MIKKALAISCCALLPIMAHAADDATPPATPTLTPEMQQEFSYAVGRDIGTSFQNVRDAVHLDAVKQGLDDAFAGRPSVYPEADLQRVKADMGKILMARMQAADAAAADANLKAASDFLKKNGKRKGVVTTDSGLQYEVIKAAKGLRPKEASLVTVHYRGTLLDGPEFDSSYARNAPATFPLNNVIPGWTEGVQLMAKGAKYKFYVPPALGYAERGAGDKIGPNTLLIFEVELLSFDEAPAGQQ